MTSQYLKKLLLRIGGPEESIDYIISKTPFVLDSFDSDVIKAGNYYLPYSTGWEMEFDNNGELTKNMFDHIEGLMHCDINDSEQRFRIPNGIQGLKCLFEVSKVLLKEAVYSDYSGIHYHIDCTDMYEHFTHTHIKDNWPWIVKELEDWHYKGTYNLKDYTGFGHFQGSWLRFNPHFKTMEFRIGAMIFDYPSLFRRIAHCNNIVRDFKIAVSKDIKETNPILLYDKNKKIKKILTNRVERI